MRRIFGRVSCFTHLGYLKTIRIHAGQNVDARRVDHGLDAVHCVVIFEERFDQVQ